MIIQTKRLLSAMCSHCFQRQNQEVTFFDFTNSKAWQMVCPFCGHVILTMEQYVGNMLKIVIHCHVCGEKHHYYLTRHELIDRQPIIFSCRHAPEQNIGYYGTEQGINGLTNCHFFGQAEQLLNCDEISDAVSNMFYIGLEFEQMQLQKRVSCSCGSQDLAIEFDPAMNWLEIDCANCHAVGIITKECIAEGFRLKDLPYVHLKENDVFYF